MGAHGPGVEIDPFLNRDDPDWGRTGRGDPGRLGDPRVGVGPGLEGEIIEGFLEEGNLS